MNKRFSLLLILVLCSALLSEANSGRVRAALSSLCSNIEVRELVSSLDYDQQGEQKLKRAAMWFGPRMGKRASHLDDYEEQGGVNVPDDLKNTIQVLLKRELDDKLGPDSQWIVYLVNEPPVNYHMSPRMGRQLGEKCLEFYHSRPPFAPRLGRTLNSIGTAQL